MSQSNDASKDKGLEIMTQLFGRPPKPGSMDSDFMQITQGNLFGDIWGRPGLKIEERSMITVAALTVLAREQELKIHLHGAKNLGISREKLEEMMIHLAHYGGWPVGVAGMRKIAEVFDKDKK